MNNCYWGTGLTGGGAALDGIDGNGLVAGDMAIVELDSGTNAPVTYFYRLQSSSTAESSPNIITPDSNPGALRWYLSSPAIKNNAASPALITAIDTGALANTDTVVPTSKAVTTAIAAGYTVGSTILTNIWCSSSGGYVLNANAKTLYYTKIGNIVHLFGQLIVDSAGATPNGMLAITLPFAVKSTLPSDSIIGQLVISGGGITLPDTFCNIASTTTLYFYYLNGSNKAGVDNTMVDTSFTVWINITYPTD